MEDYDSNSELSELDETLFDGFKWAAESTADSEVKGDEEQ